MKTFCNMTITVGNRFRVSVMKRKKQVWERRRMQQEDVINDIGVWQREGKLQ